MNHRAICYDGEGRLVCSCPIGAAEDVARDEKISRAEAHRLVEQHSLDLMSVVKGAMR